ncbi:MAG: amino acid permease [Thaumarchaeota archaeon]|nr:amino acid permease [Nitrososphaerota archaeon]
MTSLVVGSIIGADIYVAAALGARLVGPASLFIWVAAGIMAVTIALSFSHCAAVLPRVGGPYSYARDVAGPFPGFAVGWSLLLAEWFSLAVFPVAFAQYFQAFMPNLDSQSQVLVKGAFILIVLLTNVLGVKLAGRFNDFLAVSKLTPLLLIMGGGLLMLSLRPDVAMSSFQPLFTGDSGGFGQALVLIFWAYAGFELSTLPADEIENPSRTIPRAILLGMFIVTAFYFVTNFVIIATVDQNTLASSAAPLTVAGARIFSLFPGLAFAGSLVVGVGALISIMGADESGTIGTSRLAFAMSVDGLLPGAFCKLHRSYRTPYIGLMLICSTAFVASVLGTLTELINASVFLLSFAYLSTCVSSLVLTRRYSEKSKSLRGRRLIPVMGIAFSAVLMSQVNLQQILVAVMLLAAGVPIYVFFSPKKELHELKDTFMSREMVLRRTYDQGEKFLAYLVRRTKWFIYRRRRISKAWSVKDQRENKG